MKNEHFIEQDRLYIRCHTLSDVTAYMTASVSDTDTLSQYRWRLIDDRVVTTRVSGAMECSHTIDSVLTGCEKNVTLQRKDGHLLNVTRENIRYSSGRKENTYIMSNDTAYLILNGSQTVLLDSDMIPTLSGYYFYPLTVRNNIVIFTQSTLSGKIKRTTLPKVILGKPHDERVSVRFRNGDHLDCRRANMVIKK